MDFSRVFSFVGALGVGGVMGIFLQSCLDSKLATKPFMKSMKKTVYFYLIASLLLTGAGCTTSNSVTSEAKVTPGASNLSAESRRVSDMDEMVILLYGPQESDSDDGTSRRELISHVLNRIDMLSYLTDVQYFEAQRKITIHLSRDFLNDEHIESSITALADGLIALKDTSVNGKSTLAMFVDSDPQTGDVFGWNYYRLYLPTGEYVSGIPEYKNYKVNEVTNPDSKVAVLELIIGDKPFAAFRNGAAFDELNRLNLIGEAREDGTIMEAPKLNLSYFK